MFILSLPISLSMTLGVVVASLFSVSLYFIAHRLWYGEISTETRRTADSVATRIGVIHAVVLGMMFTSVSVEYKGRAIRGEFALDDDEKFCTAGIWLYGSSAEAKRLRFGETSPSAASFRKDRCDASLLCTLDSWRHPKNHHQHLCERKKPCTVLCGVVRSQR